MLLCILTVHLMVTRGSALDLLTRELEIRIGQEAAPEVEGKYGGVLTDRRYVERVQRVGGKIVSVCDRKDITYTFKVLNNEHWVNAISLPGGPIYITKRLMDMCETDEELAYVLGHEVAHIAKKHARKRISEAILTNLAASIFMPRDRLVRYGVTIAIALHERGYSRQHEREADKYGVIYMMRAGYNPNGAIKVLQRFANMERGKDDAITRLLRTHPHPKKRIEYVRKVIAKYGPKYGYTLDAIQSPKSQSGTECQH